MPFFNYAISIISGTQASNAFVIFVLSSFCKKLVLYIFLASNFIFLSIVYDEHVRRSKGGGNTREMDFDSFLDFVLALENKDTPEGLTYLFRCLDLHGRGFLTTVDIHTLFR